MIRLAMPALITSGAPELRAHHAAAKLDGADALLILDRLSRVQPEHHPKLRKRGIAILIASDRRRMAERMQQPTTVNTYA